MLHLLMFTSDSNHQSPPALKRSLYLEFVARQIYFTYIPISLLETVVTYIFVYVQLQD